MRFLVPFLLTLLMFQFAQSQSQSAAVLIQESAFNLRPTQGLVGMESVRLKAKKFSKMSNDERMAYLKAHPVPVVIGPNGDYYLIDHHHMSLALIDSGHKKLFIQVVADWSEMSASDFWTQMENSRYTYLYDVKGKKLRPQDLPKSVVGLKDDPYRSLAYFAREAGAFDKTSTPFAEFYWAAFFRQYIDLNELKDWKKATAKAVAISQKSQAANLPGYRGILTCNQLF